MNSSSIDKTDISWINPADNNTITSGYMGTKEIKTISDFLINGFIEPYLHSRPDIKEILKIKRVSKHCWELANQELVLRLNDGRIEPFELRIYKLSGMINFFGNHCANILKLDLDRDFKSADISNNFKKLTHLKLNGLFHDLSDLTELNIPTLKEFVSTNYTTEDFEFLLNSPNLTSLELLYSTKKIQLDVDVLKKLTHLESLTIRGPVNDFSFLKDGPKLKHLTIQGGLLDLSFLRHLSFLEHCENLETLELTYCVEIDTPLHLKYGCTYDTIDFSPLKNCTKLITLSLRGYKKFADASILNNLTNLKHLDISGTMIKDLSFLKNLPNLISLSCADCKEIDSVLYVNLCQNLTSLDLSGCIGINYIDYVQYNPHLKVLNLSKCNLPSNFGFLAKLPIENITLAGFKNINLFSLFNRCRSLKELTLDDSYKRSGQDDETIRQRGIIVNRSYNFS